MITNQSIAFLLGVPRSGTTLLSMLLNQHQGVYCPAEPWLLLGLDVLGQVPVEHAADSILVTHALTKFLETQRRSMLKGAAATMYRQALETSGKSVFVDKTPRYYHVLDLVESFLPDNKAILLLRNPLDVAASYQTSWDVSIPETLIRKADTPFLFDYILGFNRLLNFEKNNPVLRVYYENLVTNPQAEMARIFDYLELPRQEITDHIAAFLSEHETSSFGDTKILKTSHIHTQSINAYKSVFSKQEIATLLNALGEQTFNRLGYAAQYFDACSEFEVTPEQDTGPQLLEMAEGYALQRNIQCQNPDATTKLENRVSELSHQVESAQLQNERLSDQLTDAQAQISQMEQQLHILHSLGFRERIKSDLKYLKTWIKHRIFIHLWPVPKGEAVSSWPKITVVTPVFNGAEHIEATINSVLSQDYSNLQYIIVDGGSTDDTLQTIERIQKESAFSNQITQVISEPDNGMYDAIAKGFTEATGDILAYLNADDLLEGGALRSVGEYFATHPKVSVIYHEDTVLVYGWKYPNVRQPAGISTSDLLDRHILFQDGIFFRGSAYRAVGGVRRDLKLAGDYDLWLRLSARFKFARRPEHVSCFRIHSGQLSDNMEGYYQEVERSRQEFLASASSFRKLLWKGRSRYRTLYKKLCSAMGKDRLFFPIDFSNMPPPSVIIPENEYGNALSPVDGMPVERLLFSATDSRFGEKEIHYIYLDSRHDIAVTYPPVDNTRLEELYRKFYSSPPTEMQLPEGPSPYRHYEGKRRWEKMLLKLPVERLERYFPNLWADNTLAELDTMLHSSGIDTSQKLRFLDTGCFEGDLLEQIREHKPWTAHGLEPNQTAVAKAREKNLNVWCGQAENACEIIPETFQFDAIFMGQSIEHVDNPVLVLRRLRQLLAPGGVIVASTPNLDSREIDWFGPTWAHWHPPFHRYIFSRKGMFALARQTGLQPLNFKTFSHCYWTTMSVARNMLGLGGSVSHAINFEPALCLTAQRINFWQQVIWNRLGKGDYCFLVMKDGADE